MKSKIFKFGRVKIHRYPLPIFSIQFLMCGIEKSNQWCLGYKRIQFLIIEIMWYSPQ